MSTTMPTYRPASLLLLLVAGTATTGCAARSSVDTVPIPADQQSAVALVPREARPSGMVLIPDERPLARYEGGVIVCSNGPAYYIAGSQAFRVYGAEDARKSAYTAQLKTLQQLEDAVATLRAANNKVTAEGDKLYTSRLDQIAADIGDLHKTLGNLAAKQDALAAAAKAQTPVAPAAPDADAKPVTEPAPVAPTVEPKPTLAQPPVEPVPETKPVTESAPVAPTVEPKSTPAQPPVPAEPVPETKPVTESAPVAPTVESKPTPAQAPAEPSPETKPVTEPAPVAPAPEANPATPAADTKPTAEQAPATEAASTTSTPTGLPGVNLGGKDGN